jgi:peptidoglycan/LPS O-acetylase OafA/YrhL
VFERLRTNRRLLAGVLVLGVAEIALVGKHGPIGTTIGFTVAYVTAAALLLLVYKAAWVPKARVISVPMAFLGRYSYGIYIWHVFAAATTVHLLRLDEASPLGQVLRYGVAIAVGVLATVAVEKPVLRLRDRLFPAKDHADEPEAESLASAHARQLHRPVHHERLAMATYPALMLTCR